MASARVLVIGNCTVDLSFRVPRFPRPGETLLADDSSRDLGGKGANQAVAAARSAVSTALCAAVGADAEGKLAAARLSGEGVGPDHLAILGVPTDQSIIYVTPDGENNIVSTHAAAAALDLAAARPALETVAAGDIVLMQGNLSQAVTRACLEEGRRRQAVTLLNPAPIQYGFDAIWPFVDIAIVNEVEAEELTGCADPAGGAERLLARGAGEAIVTLGPRGALLAREDGTTVAIAAEAVEAVDTTGAGDVFCGVFSACLARGLEIEPAARGAVRAATLSVTRPGTQRAFPSRAEIDRILSDGEA